VEDEALIRLNAMAMVEEAGFEPIEASDADQAVRVLESRDDVRAVFTDVHMPGSMDGLGLAHVVAGRWPAVVLLLTSGKTEIAQSELPRRTRFIRKPYLTSEVETLLRDLMALPTS
jgi:DNA-binding NtrC family response regulator